MRFTRENLVSHRFPETRQSYDAKDLILYALGLGLGSRPTDPAHLQFTYEKGLKPLPTFAVVLAHPGFWAGDPALGIDWPRLLQSEQGLTIHRPIPLQGEVIGRSRIVDVVDRGEGRGAFLYYERDLVEASSGALIATSRQTVICRGNGGFDPGGARPPVRAPTPVPERVADHVVTVATLPQMALIYRLSGDLNPLHVDPETAHKGGFEAPILHGLATFGLAALAVIEHACGFAPERLRRFDIRFTAPVVPGETIRTEIWIEGDQVAVRARSLERDRVVMDGGRATIMQAA